MARALCSADAKKHGTVESVWKIYLPDADAAIAVALETAAKAVEAEAETANWPRRQYLLDVAEYTIRALIPSQSDKGEKR